MTNDHTRSAKINNNGNTHHTSLLKWPMNVMSPGPVVFSDDHE